MRRASLTRSAIEAGHDTTTWIAGLLVAARVTVVPARVHLTGITLWYAAGGICLVVTGCGFAAGLYRRRYLRGSRDEARAVAVAGVLATCCLTVAAVILGAGRRALPETFLGAAVAVAAMLSARYVLFAARLRSRPPAPTAEKIIVFGAGDAGSQLIHQLAAYSFTLSHIMRT